MTDAPELIFVGIDVSKDTLEVALDDRAKTCTLGNDETGLKKLLAMLYAVRERVALVLLEATGGLEQPAAAALCTKCWPPTGRPSDASASCCPLGAGARAAWSSKTSGYSA